MPVSRKVFARASGWLAAGWLAVSVHICLADGTVSFNDQIEPILSENCYPCHGPDSASRKPKKHPLRLDRESFAFSPRDDGQPVIVKGKPGESEVVRRVSATNEDRMPPASEHKTLNPEQIALMTRWIAEGAPYENHWSLIPPTRPAPPKDGEGWARNPIDNFVARGLAQAGLDPNSEGARGRLYRRLHFDLTGLPPSIGELRQFLRGGPAKDYEREVDRLLKTDASAEHFARLWLDAARYGDTQGIHLDFARSLWPYRDWVIAAYKDNLPFDQFTVQQIAGDMLPGATLEEKVASGYNRLLPTTSEGGAIPAEYEAIYAKDRVDTTTAVWLGLTMGCATCHDHKFDPVTSKDFYAMTAFFRNNTSTILEGGAGEFPTPILFVPKKEDRVQWDALEKSMAQTTNQLARREREARPEFSNWLAAAQKYVRPVSPGVKPSIWLPLTKASGTNMAGPFGQAPLALGEAVTNASPTLQRHGQASYGVFVYLEGVPNGALLSRMDKADGFKGWDIFLTAGKPAIHIVDKYPETALKVTATEALAPGRWHHVMAVFNGSLEGADAIALYVDGTKAKVTVDQNSLGSNIVAHVPLRLGGRSEKGKAADTLSGGKAYLQDFRFYDKALSPVQVARVASEGLLRSWLADRKGTNAAAESNALYEVFLSGIDKPGRRLNEELAEFESQEAPLRARGGSTLIMEEKKNSRPVAHVLIRGNYAAPGEEVAAAVPPSLPPIPPGQTNNRLGLARWMISRDNPLTARVTVNRLWSQLFGTGIVETTEDFGVMGSRPSNRPLLDWLAVEFMDSGWDFRHIVKTIVMSATYRQSEKVTPEKLEKDPLNRLLSRGPRVRLDAEEIRDQALAASGLLARIVGGPSVKPYQPEGIWETVSMPESNTRFYKQDSGPSLYRRSLYTYWKRTAPPPSMEIFDAPTREVFCTRRERTDTPLQALVTMNDPQFVEAARVLAGRAMESNKKFDGRLDGITLPLLARRLGPEERDVVHRLLQSALAEYQTDPKKAASLLAVGEARPNPKIAPAELAAWTVAAGEIMNLDECLTK